MYACKNQYHQVIKGILNRHHGNLDELDVPKVYLSISLIHNILTHRNVSCYPTVVEHIHSIYGGVPEALPFKLYSKLVFGLKMKWAMELLKNSHDDALIVLNNYFPRKGSHFKHATKKELSSLHSVQKNFRKFFLPLLAHQDQRDAYFQDKYEEEYGDKYQEALVQLADTVVKRITDFYPPTVIEKILAEGPETYQQLLRSSTDVYMEILLDALHEKEALEERDLLDLLTMISPLHTNDRVQVDKIWLHSSDESTTNKISNDPEIQSEELQPDCTAEVTTDSLTPVDSTANCEDGNNPDSDNPKRLQECFDDFNSKRHLFHCSKKVPKPALKECSELNSDSVGSPKSSGESVSILKPLQPRSRSARQHEEERQDSTSPEDLPEQVQTVSSSSPDNSEKQLALQSDSSDDTQKLNAEKAQIQEGNEDEVKGNEEVVSLSLEPWLSFEEQGATRYSSESDIDRISDDGDSTVPPSRMDDMEFWDIFSCDESSLNATEELAVPAIEAHRKPPEIKLCVVKLFKTQVKQGARYTVWT